MTVLWWRLKTSGWGVKNTERSKKSQALRMTVLWGVLKNILVGWLDVWLQRFWKSGEPSRRPAIKAACLSAGGGIGVARSMTCTKAARTGMVPACLGPGLKG